MQSKLIHWGKIWHLMQRRTADNKPIGFQLKYAKQSNGEIKEYPLCYLTSMHAKGSTINVMPEGEHRPRKIRRCLIVEFNHHRVYI